MQGGDPGTILQAGDDPDHRGGGWRVEPSPRSSPPGKRAHARGRMGPRPGRGRGQALHMRPLPRLHAITDRDVLALHDFPTRAAQLAAVGPGIALHARDRTATAAMLSAVARQLLDIAGPLEAAVFVNGRADVAAALGAQGVQLGQGDLPPPTSAAPSVPPGQAGSVSRSTPLPKPRQRSPMVRTTCSWEASMRRPPTRIGRRPAWPWSARWRRTASR